MEHIQLTQNFNTKEFDSPDKEFSGINMKIEFVTMLQAMRTILKSPVIITSGYRTVKHNKEVGGKADSEHLFGNAVDISCKNSSHRYSIIQAALIIGFKRIGIGKTFIHIDNSPSKIEEVVWLY